MENIPKVSVVMPSLNVGPFIEKCIKSVTEQTLREMEIICVDAGSTDGTLEILEKFAAEDGRIRILHSEKKSYGYQMNMGFAAASGEYLGIIETDDFAEPQMFEKLYACAKENGLDAVKSGFYYYWSKPAERNEAAQLPQLMPFGKTFCPSEDFRAPIEKADFFNIKPSIWSAIYRADFVRENGIKFNETPGAAFQDTGFNFQVWALAKKVQILPDCFLHYRQDNEQSSVNNPGKAYFICDEYAAIQRFLDGHPILKGKLQGVKTRLKYDGYIWNYNRLSDELKPEFLKRASEEFKEDLENGYAEKEYFLRYKWNTFLMITGAPEKFAEAGETGDYDIVKEKAGKKKWKRLIKGGFYCLLDHGFTYTAKRTLEKIKGRKK